MARIENGSDATVCRPGAILNPLNRRASLSRHSSARSGSTYLISKAVIRSCGKSSACLFHVLILLIQAKMISER